MNFVDSSQSGLNDYARSSPILCPEMVNANKNVMAFLKTFFAKVTCFFLISFVFSWIFSIAVKKKLYRSYLERKTFSILATW